MGVEIILQKIQDIFLELGFQKEIIGEKCLQYLCYNNCYCKITYLEQLKAFVIESTDNLKDAENEVLEDGDLYYLDTPIEEMLSQLKEDIKNYYMK